MRACEAGQGRLLPHLTARAWVRTSRTFVVACYLWVRMCACAHVCCVRSDMACSAMIGFCCCALNVDTFFSFFFPRLDLALEFTILQDVRNALNSTTVPLSQFSIGAIGCASASTNVKVTVLIRYAYSSVNGERVFRAALRRLAATPEAKAAQAASSASNQLKDQGNDSNSLLKSGSATKAVTALTAVCSLSLFCATPFSSPPRILP